MTAFRIGVCGLLFQAGQALGTFFHPDPWATLIGLVFTAGVTAHVYRRDRRPSC